MSAFTLPELIDLREKTKAAYIKSLESLRYRVGHGGTGRENERNASDRLKADMDDWNRQIMAHPDYVPARSVRRVRYLRPNF